jgi:hypothetical protein
MGDLQGGVRLLESLVMLPLKGGGVKKRGGWIHPPLAYLSMTISLAKLSPGDAAKLVKLVKNPAEFAILAYRFFRKRQNPSPTRPLPSNSTVGGTGTGLSF